MAGTEKRLFVYGTLMFSEIRDVVAGRSFSSFAAGLPGFVRRGAMLSGPAPVPGIIESAEGRVAGLVLCGVDDASLARFDVFEGVDSGLYARRPVTVFDAGGAGIAAVTYVPGPEMRARLEGEWDPEAFRRRYLGAYRRRVAAAWRGA